MHTTEKPIDWRGTSLRDLRDESLFSPDARREAGRQLSQVQFGLDPGHWKPFYEVGSGTKEIIIDQQDGWYRVMYVAKFAEAVYVLHCFKKKTNATSKQHKPSPRQDTMASSLKGTQHETQNRNNCRQCIRTHYQSRG